MQINTAIPPKQEYETHLQRIRKINQHVLTLLLSTRGVQARGNNVRPSPTLYEIPFDCHSEEPMGRVDVMRAQSHQPGHLLYSTFPTGQGVLPRLTASMIILRSLWYVISFHVIQRNEIVQHPQSFLTHFVKMKNVQHPHSIPIWWKSWSLIVFHISLLSLLYTSCRLPHPGPWLSWSRIDNIAIALTYSLYRQNSDHSYSSKRGVMF